MEYAARVMTGSTRCLGALPSGTGEPAQSSREEVISRRPSQKVGMHTPETDRTMLMKSTAVPTRIAATTPSGIPTSMATRRLAVASQNEAGNLLAEILDHRSVAAQRLAEVALHGPGSERGRTAPAPAGRGPSRGGSAPRLPASRQRRPGRRPGPPAPAGSRRRRRRPPSRGAARGAPRAGSDSRPRWRSSARAIMGGDSGGDAFGPSCAGLGRQCVGASMLVTILEEACRVTLRHGAGRNGRPTTGC